MQYLGFDIGGTKSAVVLAEDDGSGNLTFLARKEIPTTAPCETMDILFDEAKKICQKPTAVGISCGGPLDEQSGLIMSPPNLPGWDDIPIVEWSKAHFDVPTALRNDANASALAEWRYGAGRGTQNMIFLTFGTGLGAGLILGGKLYAGTSGFAGEVGHVRLEDDGPVGYRKAGSFEGFCSGGGLASLGRTYAKRALENGIKPSYCQSQSELDGITAKSLAKAAYEGDKTACEVFELCAEKLGKGLSILIDVLNPECIVLGSVFTRTESLLRQGMQRVIEKEALEGAYKVCKIVPAGLGEQIGDYAAIAVALDA
jgi:glucokinase